MALRFIKAMDHSWLVLSRQFLLNQCSSDLRTKLTSLSRSSTTEESSCLSEKGEAVLRKIEGSLEKIEIKLRKIKEKKGANKENLNENELLREKIELLNKKMEIIAANQKNTQNEKIQLKIGKTEVLERKLVEFNRSFEQFIQEIG